MTRLLEKCVAVDTPTVTDIFSGGLSEASLGELIDAADSMTRWQGPDRVWLVKRACATKNVAARTAKHESVTARPRRHGTFKEAADHLGRIYYWDVETRNPVWTLPDGAVLQGHAAAVPSTPTSPAYLWAMRAVEGGKPETAVQIWRGEMLKRKGRDVDAEASATASASVVTATASTGGTGTGDTSDGNGPVRGGKAAKKARKDMLTTMRREKAKKDKWPNRREKKQRRQKARREKASNTDKKAAPPTDPTSLPTNADHVAGAAPVREVLDLDVASASASPIETNVGCSAASNPAQRFLHGSKCVQEEWHAFMKSHHPLFILSNTKIYKGLQSTAAGNPSYKAYQRRKTAHQSSLDAAVTEGVKLVAKARRHLAKAIESLPPLLSSQLRALPPLPEPSQTNSSWTRPAIQKWTKAVCKRLPHLVRLAEYRCKQASNKNKAELNTDALVTAIPDPIGIHETTGGNRHTASAAIWSQQCRSATGTNILAMGQLREKAEHPKELGGVLGVAQLAEIENCPFFHGDISQDHAVTLLRSTRKGKAGGRAFLLQLRLRQPGTNSSQNNWGLDPAANRTSKPPPSQAKAFAFSPAQKLGVSKVAAGNAPLANTAFSFAKAVKVEGEGETSVDNQPTHKEGNKPVGTDLILVILNPQNNTHDEDRRRVSEYPLTYRPKTDHYDGGWLLAHHSENKEMLKGEWRRARTKPTLAALTDWLRQPGTGKRSKWKGLGDPAANRTSKPPPSQAKAFAFSPAQKLGVSKVDAGNAPLANTAFSFAKAVKVEGEVETRSPSVSKTKKRSQEELKATVVKAAVQPGDVAAKLSSCDSGTSADAAGTGKKRAAETDEDGPPRSKVKVAVDSAPARPPTPLGYPPASSPDLQHAIPKKRTAAQLQADTYKRLILISWEREAAAAQSPTPAELDVVRAHVSTSTGRWKPLATEADILSQMKDTHIGPSVVIEGPNLKASEVQQLVLQGLRDGLLVSIHWLEMRLAVGEDRSSFVELPPKFGIEDLLCLHVDSMTLVGCGKCGKQATAATCKLLRCSACKIQKYCSKECQVQDWHCHKSSCTASRETLAISRDPTVSQITRLVDLSRSPFWQGSVSAAATRRISAFQNEVGDVYGNFDIILDHLSRPCKY